MNFSDSDERTTEEGTPAAGSREFMTKVVCECNGKGACFARELSVRSVQRRTHVSATERERALHANLAFGAYKDERT